MKKFLFLILPLLIIKKSWAVCPLCTIAVGGGVGILKSLGVDDLISGIWIGGLTASLILWTEDWLNKKNIQFRGKTILNILFYYFLIVGSIYWFNLINFYDYYFYFLPKIIFGIILGSFVFWWAKEFSDYLKQKNNGKAYFPFQKVVIPVLSLIILSLIFYFF